MPDLKSPRRPTNPGVKHFTATEDKNRFGVLAEEIGNGHVISRKNGRDVAVLMPKSDFDLRDTKRAKKELVRKYHKERIKRDSGMYQELAE